MTENTHTTRCLFPSDSFQRQMYLLRDDAFCCRMKNWRSFLMSGLQINKTSKLNSKICQSKSRRLNSRTREMACLKGRHMNIILKFYYTLAIWWEAQKENPSTLNSAEQYPAFEHWHQDAKERKVLNLRVSIASWPRTKAIKRPDEKEKYLDDKMNKNSSQKGETV